MINYVVGFAFNPELTHVTMIFKNRGPKEVVGKWNGLGGHVEEGESFLNAMQREFEEEAGVYIEDWNLLCVYWSHGRNYRIKFYYAVNPLSGIKTNEDEEVAVLLVEDVLINKLTCHNIKWLIPLALDPDIAKPITIENIEE